MYLVTIVLLMAVLPLASIGIDVAVGHGSADLVFTIGRWFVFWAGGVRLFVAGARQVAQPGFTSKDIFGIADLAAAPLVQEIGFANLSMGLLGIVSVLVPAWVPAAAIVSGLYFGLAGLMHLRRAPRDGHERIAMVSDLAIFAVFALYLIAAAMRH